MWIASLEPTQASCIASSDIEMARAERADMEGGASIYLYHQHLKMLLWIVKGRGLTPGAARTPLEP